MEFTKEMIEKAKAAESAEELLEIAKAEGVNLTADEAAMHFAELHKSGELSDEELDNVAGAGCGRGFTPSPDGKVGNERDVVFLYHVGQEVEVFLNYAGMSTRTQRHRVLECKIGSDWTIWKDLFNAPCTYWPEYYCQNIDNSDDKRWYYQWEIEKP